MNRPLLGAIADSIADAFTGATGLADNLVRAGMRTLQTPLASGHKVRLAVESRNLDAPDFFCKAFAQTEAL